MPPPTTASISFEDGPFLVAIVDADGAIQHTNSTWTKIITNVGLAQDALELSEADRDEFRQTVRLVADERAPTWIDVDIQALADRRWARCHIWPQRGTHAVIVAVVPLRQMRSSELSGAQIDHIERILEHTADAIAILADDMSISFASGVATRWLGMTGPNYEGHQALGFVFADDHHLLIDAFTECVNAPRRSVKARFRVVHENGDLIWVEGIGTNMFDDPAVRGILVTLNDITELLQTRSAAEANKAALETEKQRYETLAQFIPTGVFELDADNRLTFRNRRFEQLIGLAANDEFSREIFDERDREALDAALERTREGMTTLTTLRLATDQSIGGPQWLTIRAVRQEGGRILASIEDATSEITKQAELAHRVDHDALTGLPNRESLLVQLSSLTAAGEPIAVLFLDLDNFKDIHDGLGHQVGDQVLIEIAGRIQAVVRPQDIVGRLHGDEFLVVCRHTADIGTAREIASRVVIAVGEPLATATQGLLVSGSIGIAMNGSPDIAPKTPEQLLVAADAAMYEAKRRGGSRSVPFNADLGKRAADRLRLHGEVQRASELDELGMWVIERVVADLALAGPNRLPVNVNVSPRQLSDESFARAALKLLHDYDVPGPLLTIEITELVLMSDFGPVEQQLRLLQRNGVGIAIDDFGTGYSALAYLQRFPFDQIKIDGVFIDEIDRSPNDRAIVKSVIDLVTSLGATPIAEKVERQAQADVLLELGCPYAQGFLLGRPAPIATRH